MSRPECFRLERQFAGRGLPPKAQLEFTLLAWAVALTLDKKLYPSVSKYICAAKGKAPARKKALLDAFGYSPWGDLSAAAGNRHINYEFIVDLLGPGLRSHAATRIVAGLGRPLFHRQVVWGLTFA